jgi:nucleoid-associated protein YgaU
VLRARVTVSFKSYEPIDIQAKSVKTQSPDRYKTRTVREGDRLDLIAADEYGDPTLWRPIAQENNLASPRQLAVGSVLVIPTL